MFKKQIDTSQFIHDLLATRWSGRAYDPGRPVTRAQLLSLLEAARWAPSCFGDQPWRVMVWDRVNDPANWQRAFAALAEGNQSWAAAAPILLLASADSVLTANGSPNRWGPYDTGAAMMSLCIQATSLGLMVHQMGGFEPERIRAEFAIPERYSPMAMATIGYQLPESAIPADMKEREFAPRRRRALGENFFESGWEVPVRTL